MTKWKDANEFLTKGDGDDLKWAAIKPQRWTPENFFCSDGQIDKILREENPYEYTATGHSGIDETIRGLVKGGLTFLKAPPGSGKTELFRFLEMGLLTNSPTCKIGILHMEEMKSTTYRCMATYKLGVNVRTEDDAKINGITEDEVIKAAQDAAKQDRTIVFEMKSGDDPMAVLDYCNLAARVYGAEYIFIDHVQRLAYLGGIEGATNTLTKLAANLAQLAKELNVGIIMISHVNEDGHTKYAKSLEEEAIICIRIERDKEAKDEETRNTTRFYIEKNRPFSRLGLAGAVYYDPETTLLSEVVL
jgi:replicative DNA helicase